MEILQIKIIILSAAAFANIALAFVFWFRGRNKITFHLGWLSLFSGIFAFSWVGMYLFECKLLFARATWFGPLTIAPYMIFIYYFTNNKKYLTLKIIFWYFLAIFIVLIAFFTPLIIPDVSKSYPYITSSSNNIYNSLGRIFIIIGIATGIYYLGKEFFKSKGFRRLQIKYFLFGVIFYSSASLLIGGIIPFFFYDKFYSYIDIIPLFSVVWVGLTAYAILKKKLLKIKIILTELLVVIIGLILLIQILIINNFKIQIANFFIFLLFCWIGYMLIMSVYKEVKKEEEAEELAAKLANLNKTLEKRVNEKTLELQKNVEELLISEKDLSESLKDACIAKKNAEEEKAKTLSIISNFSDGILIFYNNKLQIANSLVEKFFDIKFSEIKDKSIYKISKKTKLKKFLDVYEKKSKKLYREEFYINENLVIEASSISIINNEKIIGELIVLHDITREKLVEKSKSDFLTLTAHQFRTPLTVIKWGLLMLYNGDVGKMDKKQKKILSQTIQGNEKLVILVNDLLDVIKIEEGKFLNRMINFNVEEMIKQIIDNAKKIYHDKKIKIEYIKPSKSLPPIKGDKEKIEFIFYNIIDNAIDYSPPKSLVSFCLKRNADNIVFTAKDEGIGIPKVDQQKIFTKFYRASNAFKVDTTGSGLGLFIAKNIAESHGGKIWFESKEKIGSTFFISLPLSQDKKNI